MRYFTFFLHTEVLKLACLMLTARLSGTATSQHQKPRVAGGGLGGQCSLTQEFKVGSSDPRVHQGATTPMLTQNSVTSTESAICPLLVIPTPQRSHRSAVCPHRLAVLPLELHTQDLTRRTLRWLGAPQRQRCQRPLCPGPRGWL